MRSSRSFMIKIYMSLREFQYFKIRYWRKLGRIWPSRAAQPAPLGRIEKVFYGLIPQARRRGITISRLPKKRRGAALMKLILITFVFRLTGIWKIWYFLTGIGISLRAK